LRPSQPPARVAIAAHGHNGDQASDFLLFASGPLPFDYEQGVRFGEARAQIKCGATLYDTVMTDPLGALDVDRSTLNAFITGDVHIQYPHEPNTFINRCPDASFDGLDCTDDYVVNVQSGVCRGGKCVITCKADWADCVGIPQNGCEISLTN